MNYLSVEGLSKSYGEKLLFDNLVFGIEKGQKAALIAKNGTGKSTLLKILSGLDEPDSGTYTYRKDVKVTYVSQTDSFDESKSVIENLLGGKSEIANAILEYEKAILNPDDTKKYQAAFEKMDELNAWDYETQIQQILGKLGIHNLNQQVKELSGGQKKRLSLARGLATEADFYILDEPTNHLDLNMIEWLENYLVKANSTLLLVTHDRYFLDRICDTIFELDNGNIYKYKGNFSYFIEKKAERESSEAASVDKAKNLMRKELEWVRRMPKARGTKSKSRLDAFQELKAKANSGRKEGKLEFTINPERLGSKILEFHKTGLEFPNKLILDNFSYVFKQDDRIAIVGDNGVGKSSFLNLITQQLEPTKGKVVVGETIKFGYYGQEGLKIKEDKRVIEVIKDIAEYVPLKKGKKLYAAQLLERFLIPNHMHFQYVSTLSGGEKRKLYLLTILMQNPNFLILDEPTNDLDIQTLSALEDYLTLYPGILIVVSHDRYFTDKIVDHVFALEGGGQVKDFPGNYSQYRYWLDNKKKEIVKEEKETTVKQTTNRERKLSYKEKIEFEQLEKDIEKLEAERDKMNELVSTGNLPEDSNQFFITLGTINQELEEKSDRWLELSEFA